MARLRTIKPGFFTNEYLAECGPEAMILFAGLWCIADREGRLEDRPARIKVECLPYFNADPNDLLQRLHDRGFIQRYEADGSSFIQVLKFSKHQTPHVKEKPSTIQAPDKPGAFPVLAPPVFGDLSLGSGNLGVGITTLSSPGGNDPPIPAVLGPKRSSRKRRSEEIALPVPDHLNGEAWPSPVALAALYNEVAADECPAVTTLDPERQRKAASALRLYPEQVWWREAFGETRQSRFLRGLNNDPGGGHKRFRATFDWFLQGGQHDRVLNAVKAIEGRYRDGR